MKKLTSFEATLAGIILVHLLVLFKSNFFPYPEFFVYPYLTNLGLLPYAQILDQHFPGLMFFPVNLANLGFAAPEHLRILQASTVVAIHILIYKIAVPLAGSKKAALMANVLYFVLHPFFEGYVLWIDSFVPVLTLGAFCLLVSRNRRGLFFAGFLVGLAVLLKQVVIPISLLVAVWLWFTNKDLLKHYLGGLFLPVGLMFFYIASKGLMGDFIYWTYTFNVTYFAQMGRKYASLRQVLATSTVYLPAFIISFYGFVSKKRELALLALLFFGSLLFAYARFDYVHLQPSLPFAILLLAYFFGKLPYKFADNLFVLYLIPVVWVATRFFINNFGGSVYFFGSTEYKIADRIRELTERGDPIFMYGTLPHMYQLTGTRPSGNVFVFHFPWFMKAAEDKVLEGLVKEPPRVVVMQDGVGIDNYNLYDYMPNINNYVSQNYEKIDEIGGVAILIPNANRN